MLKCSNELVWGMKISQQLRKLPYLPEDLSLIPAKMIPHNYLQIQFLGELMPSSGLHMHMVHRNAGKTLYTNSIFKFKKLKSGSDSVHL